MQVRENNTLLDWSTIVEGASCRPVCVSMIGNYHYVAGGQSRLIINQILDHVKIASFENCVYKIAVCDDHSGMLVTASGGLLSYIQILID